MFAVTEPHPSASLLLKVVYVDRRLRLINDLVRVFFSEGVPQRLAVLLFRYFLLLLLYLLLILPQHLVDYVNFLVRDLGLDYALSLEKALFTIGILFFWLSVCV